MKKIDCIIFVLLIRWLAANFKSPGLLEEIIFTKQEQIDNFQANYRRG